MFRLVGTVAVMVTLPTAMQVAVPLLLMVAILGVDVAQVSPSLEETWRLELFSSVAVAVKATLPGGLVRALAVCGLTARLTTLGLPDPHPTSAEITVRTRMTCPDLGFMDSPVKLDCKCFTEVG